MSKKTRGLLNIQREKKKPYCSNKSVVKVRNALLTPCIVPKATCSLHRHNLTLLCFFFPPGSRCPTSQSNCEHDSRAIYVSTIHHNHVQTGVIGTRTQILRC